MTTAIRATVISNVNQSQKALVLIPSETPLDPNASTSFRSLINKAAQSKLRIKKPSRTFLRGGYELKSEDDWRSAVKRTAELVVLVSVGEDYVGTRSQRSVSGCGATNLCTIAHLHETADVDSTSIIQLETTAKTLPGIIHACAQPDLHPGTKYPIGAVFVSRGWIHPPLIGSDIGCGMAWYKTTLSRGQVEGDKGRKIAEKLRGLEGPWRTQSDREAWLGGMADHAKFSAGPAWDLSLGTIGAGNHFAELQVVEESASVSDDDGKPPEQLYPGEVVLLVHSGSRGYGGDILKRYTKDSTVSLREEDARLYLEEHDRACGWASRNRDLIALRFLAILEPGAEAWCLGVNDRDSYVERNTILETFRILQSRKVVDIHHNNVEQTTWPTTLPLEKDPFLMSQQCKVYIHRKGAAPTYDPQSGSPLSILPLPGSRATPTLIIHPTFSAVNDQGRLNAFSLAHGAGRARSRADAAAYVAEKYKGRADDLLRGDFVRSDRQGNKRREMTDGTDVNGGTWVVCEDKQLVWEEAGEAYKDVWAVGADLVAKGCAERWGWCRGRVSYKVRKE